MNTTRSTFSSRIGFVLATAGSAVGLGNIWRFPYLAAKYGGGSFLLIYILLAVTFGFTLMITELAIGRKTGKSAIGAFTSLDKRFSFIGYLGAIVPTIIFPYYCVIGGWVIKYGLLYGTGKAELAAADGTFGNFISGTAEPLTYFFIYRRSFRCRKGYRKVQQSPYATVSYLNNWYCHLRFNLRGLLGWC